MEETNAHTQAPEATEGHTSLRDQPFAGGFFLTKFNLKKVANFQPFQLTSEWTFWHDARGTLKTKVGKHQCQVVLFGTFFHLEENDSTRALNKLVHALERGTSEFEAELDFLVGRFVLITVKNSQCHIYHDALGTRSIYYATNKCNIASHFNLLLLDSEIDPPRTWRESRMAMDLTKSSAIRQLLPNFKLNANTREITRYFPVQENEFADWSHAQKQTEITRLWKNALNSLFDTDKKIVYSITGGLDSRLSLAMANERWSDLTLYTYGTKNPSSSNYSQVMNRDFLIAQNLVNIIQPNKYYFIDLTENKKIEPTLSLLLNSNSIIKHGPGLVQRYRDKFPGDNWIHVRSTGLEVTRNYFGANDSLDSIIRTCEKDGATGFQSRIDVLGYASHLFGYNKKDLIYWELRMGKWHSEVLNENDAAFETILPHNNRRIIKLFLAYDLDERRRSFPLKELINNTAPLLNFFGVNDTRNLYEITRDVQTPCTNSTPPIESISSRKLLRETSRILSSRLLKSTKKKTRNLMSPILKKAR